MLTGEARPPDGVAPIARARDIGREAPFDRARFPSDRASEKHGRTAEGGAVEPEWISVEGGMAFGKGHHLHLVDGSAFIFRAYHALPPLTRKSDGLPIGAVSGFCNMLWNQIIKDHGADAPTHAAIVFD